MVCDPQRGSYNWYQHAPQNEAQRGGWNWYQTTFLGAKKSPAGAGPVVILGSQPRG